MASEAIESASQVVGRYLLMLTFVNLAFGGCVGIVLSLLGLPNPELWAFLAFLLRYIPYVGVTVAGGLPTLVAFAVFPGWSKSIEVLAFFLVLDQLVSHFIEPFVLGSRLDLSPVALLISTVYWSWLWGVPGLLLAVPLTACLRVVGDHIPAFNFLSLILGGQRTLEDYHDFYRMLLEIDQTGARGLAIRYCNENGLEPTFDDVLNPTVQLGGQEHLEGHISNESFQFIVEAIGGFITDLGSRFYEPRVMARARVLGVTVQQEAHNLGLLMILELFRQAGATVRFVGENKTPEEVSEIAHRLSADVACISCTVSESLTASAQLVKALKVNLPGLVVIAGGIAALAYPKELINAGCSQVIATRSQARRAIRQLAAESKRVSNSAVSEPASTE